MTNQEISVIMSVYNSKRYLSESIESILNQTFKNFEFIIVDDGSTDDSLGIIKEFMKKDKRILLINNNSNIGLTKSLNKALKKAKGKYIARMDTDDVSMPERLEKQYNFLEKNEDVFLVGTGSINIDETGENTTTFNPIVSFEEIKKTLPYKNCIYHPSIMFRNEKGICYREKFVYSQDYDLYLRLLSNGKKLVNLPDKLIKYRCNPNAITQTKRGKQALFAEKAREFYFQRIKYGKDNYEEFNPREILDLDVENSTNKTVLRAEISASFKMNDFKRTRRLCKKYFKHYGIFNKFFIYYLLSFTGRKFVNFMRRVLFD